MKHAATFNELIYVLLVGTCTISPLTGIAIQTNFIIKCTGFADNEHPIIYEVSHFTSFLTTIICRKTESHCNAIFPIGHGSNSTLNVRVRVIDALSMFTEFNFEVKVSILNVDCSSNYFLKYWIIETKNRIVISNQ